MTKEWTWDLGTRTMDFSEAPRLMGILNVTPDSFSDGGQFVDTAAALDHASRLVADGADVLDIGGESTRPGSQSVDLNEELRRVIPVIEAVVAQVEIPVSIDTTKSAVARESLAAGASIVNDISGCTFDPAMIDVCAASQCGVVCMHIRGTPQNMQDDPRYENVVAEVGRFLAARLEALEQRGVARDRVVLDPGIGFGKTAAHNVELLSSLDSLHELGRPLLIGHSRKRFLAKVLGRSIEERDAGTLGVSIGLASLGADILRVHDVRATRDAITAWRTVVGP